MLGISANAASIRLHRAKRELADLLEARKRAGRKPNYSIEEVRRRLHSISK